LTNCSGTCVNLQKDNANCGSCANQCTTGQKCVAGKCALSCQTGLTNCSGMCVNLKTDSYNCGACANACKAGETCTSGKCVLSCQTGLTNCSGTCVNLKTDQYNCGTCGTSCKLGTYCCAGGCVDPLTNDKHCGKCNNACSTKEKCIKGSCLGYKLTISKLGCRYIDVTNTGTQALTSFAVTVDGASVPITAPSGGIAVGKTGRIWVAYIMIAKQKVVVTAHGVVNATYTQTAACPINIAFAKYGDQGGDILAVIRTVNNVGADFKAKTGLGLTTKKLSSSACGLGYSQYFAPMATVDLTDIDFIYYHSHNVGSVNSFTESAATLKKLYEWVKRGGLILFDDCGGMASVNFKSSFGITFGFNGQTGGSGYSCSFKLGTDLLEKPYKFTAASISKTSTWSEGGQTSLVGMKVIATRYNSAFLSGAKVGNGWVAAIGGDFGCRLNCGCSAGYKDAHQLMANFAYISSGRAKLIK